MTYADGGVSFGARCFVSVLLVALSSGCKTEGKAEQPCVGGCEAVSSVRALSAPSSMTRWEELGPSAIGGRVSAIAVDPRDEQHVLLGTPAGGLWQWTAGASSWTSLAPWLSAVPISALAIHPTDANVAFAGTGAIGDGSSVRGAVGIIRSTDGGRQWSPSSLPPSASPPYISSLLIWSQEPSRVLAGTDVGVLFSTDGGLTFSKSLEGDGISTLVRDPFDAEAVYAAGRASLFRSSDRGQTWTRLSGWPLLETDKQGAGTVTLALSSKTPGLVYATVQVLASFTQTDRVLTLKSTDGGRTFGTVNTAPAFCPTTDSCGFAQAFVIDPSDDSRLLVGGDKLYSSTNAGASWTALAGSVFGVHELRVYAQGVYVVGKFGMAVLDSTWTTLTPRNQGLAIASVVDLDVSNESPPRFLAATNDLGTVLGTGALPSWNVIFGAGASAGPARFDPFMRNRLYASKPKGALFRSEDNGVSFVPMMNGVIESQTVSVLAPLEPNLLVPGTLYTGRSQLFASVNSGNAWTAYRPEGAPELLHIAPSPVDVDRVYFTLAQGPNLYKADDIHTEVLTPTTDASVRIDSVFLDPRAENVLYVAGTHTATQAGRVFKSYDFGAHWDDISPPNLSAVTSIVKDAFGVLYVGTAGGVFRSANDGFTWVPFNDGLLASGITRLKIAGGYLFAATTGRGVFRIQLGPLVSVDSIPPGMQLSIDGQVVTGPVFDVWAPGSSHTVAPLLLQTADTRQEFVSWSDGAALSHTVMGTGGNLSLTAAVRTSFRLATSTSPPASGDILNEPASTDGFYSSQSVVNLVASAAPSQRFAGWTGELSGGEDILGVAVMDKPRTVGALFSPLQLKVQSSPPGLVLSVDGQSVTTPASFIWNADSAHALSAPDTVDLNPADAPILAFDHWSDLLPRAHAFTMRREGFIPDLTAHYIQTVPAVTVPSGGAAVLRTPGQQDAPRMVSLEARQASGNVPELAVFLSGSIDGIRTTEWVLVPQTARTELDTFVEGGGVRGRTRLVLHNPGGTIATVALQLRNAAGTGIVARSNALTVPPGGAFVGELEDLILLSPQYEGLLTLLSDRPLLGSVQSIRENLRPNTLFDPIVVAPFTSADRNVPPDPRVQVLLRTPDTEHRLVIFNPGLTAATGLLRGVDANGSPLPFTQDGAALVAYNLPPGGYATYRFHLPAVSAGASLVTARMELLPQAGPPPQVQLVEEHTVATGTSGNPDLVLPRTVPPSRVGVRFVVPVDGTRRDSGVVLSNPGPSPVVATATLLAMTGQVVSSVQRTVATGGQLVLLASELFGSSSQQERLLQVTTPTVQLGVGILRSVNARGEEILAGWPGFDGGPTGPALTLPDVIDGDSWSSHLWFYGNAPTGAVGLTTHGQDGSVLRLPMEVP